MELAKRFGLDPSKVTFEQIIKVGKANPFCRNTVITTASDGNHGAGLAWVSSMLPFRCIIWLPKGVAQSRIDTIENLGAEVNIPGICYDDTVALCAKTAKEKNWVLIQDTAWEGYTEVPTNIISGYTMMMEEVTE
jgi:diaminopropionate ammonia-lyase